MSNMVMQWADAVCKAKPYDEKTKRGECARFEEHGIRLIQKGVDRFTVVYGRQVVEDLSYVQASLELGSCIMHALASNSMLDNRERVKR